MMCSMSIWAVEGVVVTVAVSMLLSEELISGLCCRRGGGRVVSFGSRGRLLSGNLIGESSSNRGAYRGVKF